MDIQSYLIIGLLFALVGAVLFLARTVRKSRADTDSSPFLLLSQRLEALQQQVSAQLEQGRQAAERSSTGVFEQVRAFTQGLTQLQDSVKTMHDRVQDVATFQEIFRSPKLRGIWGESSLESTLAQYFSPEAFTMQHYFGSGEAVDAVLRLPNDLLLPIDSKFNWENFEKTLHATEDTEREQARRQFLADVRKKIDEIANKYILPSEGTTDFALMYMPAETLYYEVIQNIKEVDLASYARGKKVILVSPNTFFLTVSAVLHWYRDAQFSQQTQAIMKRLGRVMQDAGKLSEDFRVLGKHLGNAKGAYEDTEKRLGLLVDRTQKVIEMGEKEQELEAKNQV